jgi:hypothetical protein
MRRLTGSVVAAVLGVCLAGCGGTKPLILGAYDSQGGAAYVCSVSPNEGSGNCAVDTTNDETRWKRSGAVYVPFQAPLAQCDTGIQRILIENPQSGYTTLLVECAPRPTAPTSQ